MEYTEYSMMSTSKKDPGEKELEKQKEDFLQLMERAYGEDFAKSLRVSFKDPLDESACWHCRRPESALGEGEQLRSCSGCRKVRRTVLYCSQYVTRVFTSSPSYI